MMHTGRIYGAPVMFGENLKLSIDDRLVAATPGNGGFQVVGTMATGTPPKECSAFSQAVMRSSLRWDHTASQ